MNKGSIILHQNDTQNEIREPVTQFLQIGDLIGNDLVCIKKFCDDGYYSQSVAMSRLCMESGLTLSILVSQNKLSDWLNNVSIRVPINKGKKTKEISLCTYGNLIDAFGLMLNDKFSNSNDGSISSIFPIKDLSTGILQIHKEYRSTANSNKYVHKSPEVINNQRYLLRNYLLVSHQEQKQQSDLFHTIVLDIYFQLLALFQLCLTSQAASRYIELVQLLHLLDIDLGAQLKNELISIGSNLLKSNESFQKEYENFLENWNTRQDNLDQLSKAD